jgi:shikimate dehydrogenase
MGADFDTVFRHAATGGFRGINVTYPYKELAAARVAIDDPLVGAIGAVNTVTFPAGSSAAPKGYNTDHSGFVAAMRAAFGRAEVGGVPPPPSPPHKGEGRRQAAPARAAPDADLAAGAPSPLVGEGRGGGISGPVCMIGAGGVGKAVAFGLVALGAEELRIVERDLPRADALARSLAAAGAEMRVSVTADAAEAARGAVGLINCTPVGMVGHAGTPLACEHMPGAEWAFDAVYTPVDTQFLTDAAAAGLAIILGYELFFHQGVDAWALFSGRPVDPAALRAALIAEGAGP